MLKYRFEGNRCNSTDEYYKFDQCSVKSFSREENAFTIVFTILKDIAVSDKIVVIKSVSKTLITDFSKI